MFKKLVLILNFLGFMNLNYCMEQDCNNSLKEQVLYAYGKKDLSELKRLTSFHVFLKKGNLFELDKYLEKLKQLGLSSNLEISDFVLIYGGINYLVDSNGTRLLQHFVSKNRDKEIIKEFIRNSSPKELNLPNKNDEKLTILHLIEQIILEIDPSLVNSMSDYLMHVSEELLKYGANPLITNKRDIAFKQTDFFKRNEARFLKCEEIYKRRIKIQKAYKKKDILKIKGLTKFDKFVSSDGDEINAKAYEDKLDKFGIPRTFIYEICSYNNSNYKDNLGNGILSMLNTERQRLVNSNYSQEKDDNQNTTYFKNYKKIALLSLGTIAMCYISYKMLSNPKQAVSSNIMVTEQ